MMPRLLSVALLCAVHAASASASVIATGTLTRDKEPAIVAGAALPSFAGASTTHLWAYAYRGGAWVQIPVQVDQRNASGNYFDADADPTFDANDEVVFMATDMGDQVSADEWIADAESRTFPRYEVQVADATNPSRISWAYVYRSSTITRTFSDDYVGYTTSPTDSLYAQAYSLAYNSSGILTGTRVTPAGGGDNVDIVDRQKLRVTAKILFLTFNYTENDFPATTTRFLDGPVRVITEKQTNSPAGTTIGYSSYYAALAVPLSPTDIDNTITFVRGSVDLSPDAVGMTMYDDFNPSGVSIDGVPDAGVVGTIPTWVEITGAHGTIIVMGDGSGVGGTQSLYYKDNANINSGDTGDLRSYGDTGFQITSPNAGSYANLVGWVWYLPANVGNVGATYRAYTSNPLAPAASAQDFTPVAVSEGPRAAPPRVHPMPVRSLAHAEFTLDAAAHTRMDVLDIRGRLVRTLVDAWRPVGPLHVQWDCADAAGRRVPGGVYVLRLTAGDRTIAAPFVVTR